MALLIKKTLLLIKKTILLIILQIAINKSTMTLVRNMNDNNLLEATQQL
jgi:hypothetical protein